MALVVADRVKETTTTTGTGAITLAGAEVNFVAFSSVLSDGDTTYYAIVDDSNQDFEVGLGTYATSGNTLTRTTVLASSNGGSAVDLSAGSKEVFINYPAGKSVYLDGSGQLVIGGTAVTSTAAELNILDGVTATTAEINILDGVTATTTELNYVDGVTSNIQTQIDAINPSPSITATASGAISNGDPVVVNPSGQLETVFEITQSSSVSSSTTISNTANQYWDHFAQAYNPDDNALGAVAQQYSGGSIVKFFMVEPNDGGIANVASATISNPSANSYVGGCAYIGNSKWLVIYGGNSNVIYSRVITRTGAGTFSQGTEVNTTYRATNIDCCYDSDNDKVVVFFADNLDSENSKIAYVTVSGTTPTWSSKFTLDATVKMEYYGVSNVDSIYIPEWGVCAVSFLQDGDTNGYVWLVDSSGATPSVGTKTFYDNQKPNTITLAYDATQNMLFLAYSRINDSDNLQLYGYAQGSGTTLGSATNRLEVSSGTVLSTHLIYDSYARRTYHYYQNDAASGYIYRYPIAVSGSTISKEETETTVLSSSVDVVGGGFDTTYNQHIVLYEDGATKTLVSDPAFTFNNLTARNFAGFSDANYSSGATATAQVVGSVDDAQTGLTAGQGYFVQLDGTLATTADTTEVFAGLALSSTEILIKG
jgi:hypothetical protein